MTILLSCSCYKQGLARLLQQLTLCLTVSLWLPQISLRNSWNSSSYSETKTGRAANKGGLCENQHYSSIFSTLGSAFLLLLFSFRLQFPLLMYLFLKLLSLCPHLTFWLPPVFSPLLNSFDFSLWLLDTKGSPGKRKICLFVWGVCVQVYAGQNVLWLTLASVKAVMNSNFVPVYSPHPPCLFLLPLSELLLFPVNCALLLLFALIANILVPVLLLPCCLPLQLQLPSAPLHHRNSLSQLLMTFPMLQPSYFLSRIVSLHRQVQLFPPVHQLLSSQVHPPWERSQLPSP